MKIRFILFLSVLLGLTFSCKKDNSKQEMPETVEVRQWKPEDVQPNQKIVFNNYI